MLVNYSRSHRARYFELSYEVTGRINRQYNNFTRFFSLAENNRRLTEENARLNNLLKQNFALPDTNAQEKAMTIVVDSQQLTRKYLWRPARVINNSVAEQNNYITLERGRKQGVATDMAVVGPTGIVGVVTDVSDNMCIVMSLLHRKSFTSVAHKKTLVTGNLEWNGKNPELLQVRGIPKSTKVAKGDTIVTSNLSIKFPEGLVVGTIAEIRQEAEGNNYVLYVKPGANFYTLEQVYVIENKFLKEQQELESRTKKQ